jgi:flagellar hook-length control protein FliK
MQALLAIILKLSQPKQQQQQQEEQQQEQEAEPQQQQQQQQLEAFLRAQPVSTSIPFIAWLADMEAAATGGGT